MNKELLPYEELLEKYRDLQLRVTRFSSIEQSLINTQDLLDQELVLYKRLSKFNKDSLSDLSKKKFIQLVTEAIVDIFETEFSMVLVEKFEGGDSEFILFSEGFRLSDEIKINYISDILKIGKILPTNKSTVCDEKFLKNYTNFLNFSKSIYYHVYDTDSNLSIYLFGLVGKKRQANFTDFQTRHETIFNIFAQQVQSLYGNIEKSLKIKSQFETIISSEREQRKLSQIATKTTNGVIISDEFGKIVWVNDAFQNITGYKFEEVIGKKPKDFLQGKDTGAEALLKLKHALQNKIPIELTLINYKKNKQKYFNSLQITPVFDENGKHQNFIALQKDITEEEYAKNELLNVNARFELITEKSHIGIWEWDLKSGKTVWNHELVEQFGADSSKMEQDFFNYWKTFLQRDEAIDLEIKIEAFIKSNQELFEDEYTIIQSKTKEIKTLKTLIIAERDSGKNLVKLIGTTIDVTEVKKNENALQQNLQQQELLAEISLELNHVTTFKDRINGVLNKLLNHTNVSRVYIFENVDNTKACSNTFEVCNIGISPQIDELAYVEYKHIPYWKTTLLDRGIIYSENIELLPHDVRAVLEPQNIKSIIVFPLFVKGDFFGFIGFDECLTYKKWTKSELELLRAVSGIISNTYERDISEKNLINKNLELGKINSELDNFVYSVSHDLRSPLLSVKGILSLIHKTTQIDEKANNYLKMAEKSILRLDGTIKEILDYSRNARLEIKFEEFSLQELVTAIYDDLKYSTSNKVEFKTELSFNHSIKTDKARLNTLLKNIISNAFKYLKTSIDNSYILFKANIENHYLTISVSDNGEGIASEHLSKIFDMFYRASKSNTGTGLGLYICKEIMNKLNGEITITSDINQGTTVFLKIPLQE